MRGTPVRRWCLTLIILASLLPGLASMEGCTSTATTGTPAASTPPSGPPTATPGVATATATVEVTTATTERTPTTPAGVQPITFAIIGDYGTGDRNQRAVSELVASWNPSFVVTTGDNYYAEVGGSGTGRYDRSVGAYYGAWVNGGASSGSSATDGAAVRGFFPAMGNHDYTDAAPDAYLKFFDLPGAGLINTSGNERFYDYVQGPVHFFALNSNTGEPEGTSPTSTQGRWLRQQLAASTSPWNIVYTHHPPYSSDILHGPTQRMQWPFAAWGADAVIAGHSHSYERIARDGIVYFVNGLGGEGPRYLFAEPVTGSQSRYNGAWGAQLATATDTTLDFAFYNTRGELVDSCRLTTTPPAN